MINRLVIKLVMLLTRWTLLKHRPTISRRGRVEEGVV